MAGDFKCNLAWCFLLWVSFVSVFAIGEYDGKSIVLATEMSSIPHKQARRKLDDVGGSISIDCGLPGELEYIDRETQIHYVSDSKYINTGRNHNISDKFISETLQETYENVRSFPEGKRNCYKLNHPEGRNTIYLIRASFMYGNYDGLNQLPKFNLYMGVNLWDSVTFKNSSHVVTKEILHVPVKDEIYVCLENTDMGTPFISALELRHFHNSSYRTKSGSLLLYQRLDFGSTTNKTVRFNEDSFDRIWLPYNLPEYYTPLSTSFAVDTTNKTEYELPSAVMKTAVTPRDSSSLEFQFETGDPTLEFYVYMHFAEIEELQENERREFNITVNGNLWHKSLIPNYLHSTTIFGEQSIRGSKLMFSMHKQQSSTLPPIINAIEIYIGKDFLQAPTDEEDG
ncbi:putative leucine-rich repeat receptor-like protein kinase [Senna tora]|uniref:Putative leucine-rich repeat receptor-like protein kinase n=1 Tax=Senna tora TaxID=362788 RepID=A0A834XF44_9FABA|nr:putative leucine-rich repeat receptor-like protein kinase [Senna tora]